MRRGGWPLLIMAFVAILGMLAANLLQPVTWVRVATAGGTRLACARVDGSTPITLEYTHSMFGGFVREEYRLRPDGSLERTRMVTENAAAAEYYATDGAIRHTDDGYDVISPPFFTERLAIRVDERGRHRLTIGSVTHPLYDQLGGSTRVLLEGKRSPLHDVPRMCRASSAAPVASVAIPAQHGVWSMGRDRAGSVG